LYDTLAINELREICCNCRIAAIDIVLNIWVAIFGTFVLA
jgi:hypothetical protein